MPSTLIVGEVIHTHDLSSYSFAKGGHAKQNWCGGRGVFSSGGPDRTIMDYVNIGTSGNALDFAESATGYNNSGTVSNGWRGMIVGGSSPPGDADQDQMQYYSIGTLADAVDFSGELNAARSYLIGGASNGARGVVGGGSSPTNPYSNAIDFFGFIPGADAKDFGNLTEGRLGAASGVMDGNRGAWCGGHEPGMANIIDYVVVGTADNAVDLGDLTQARHVGAATSNGSRGIMICGATYDTIDYFIIGRTGNAIDFGDATVASNYLGATSDGSRGMRQGGDYPPAGGSQDAIDYVNIGVKGDAIDFGDLTLARSSVGSTSGD
tara:strand:- start:259 stop:1224 length:966 start_codon:yes stop_codon:yes gene_type:complete